MKNMKHALLAAVAVVGSIGLAGSANAQFATAPSATQAIYGGGSTLASKVYRQLFDCWDVRINTYPLPPTCWDPITGAPIGDTSGTTVQILYAPVGDLVGLGSGYHLQHAHAFAYHESGINNAVNGLGTPDDSNTVPFVTSDFPSYPYPDLHFAGSESPIAQTDVNLYNSNNGPANYGAILQIPAFSATVTIPFNGKDSNGNYLNIVNAIPPGGSSGLNLSRQALCGIFTGHITRWDNPILTTLNGGTPLGSGTITVVHRSDGDGETFLLTSALVAQCAGVIGPNNETDATPALYEFRYTDRATTIAQCNGAIPVRGASLINWPDLVQDQCAQPIAPRNTGGGTYIGWYPTVAGSSGMVHAVTVTNGAIGYVSPDFVQPVVLASVSGLATANLESQYDIDNNTGKFQPPTPYGAATAMSATKNPTFDDTSILNPINWSHQGVMPNPLLPGSYPISGFTWLDFYQCYKAADLAAIQAYIIFHYTNMHAQSILFTNGFASTPSYIDTPPTATSWVGAVSTLLFSSTSAMGNCGMYAGQ